MHNDFQKWSGASEDHSSGVSRRPQLPPEQIHAFLQQLHNRRAENGVGDTRLTQQINFCKKETFHSLFGHDIHICLIQCQDIDDILKNAESSLLHARVIATVFARLAIGGLTIAAIALEEWEHLAPERVGRVQEGSFIGIDGRTFPDKVGGHRSLELGSLEHLPEGEENGCEQNHGVLQFMR